MGLRKVDWVVSKKIAKPLQYSRKAKTLHFLGVFDLEPAITLSLGATAFGAGAASSAEPNKVCALLFRDKDLPKVLSFLEKYLRVKAMTNLYVKNENKIFFYFLRIFPKLATFLFPSANAPTNSRCTMGRL